MAKTSRKGQGWNKLARLASSTDGKAGQGLPRKLPVVSMLAPPHTFKRLSTETKVHISQDLVGHS